ncbi:MAG: hypothetical protein M3285_08360 [Actinomycetota bacterium]|nr:hypothetical protein [Actinomycetota bacterium]
MIKTSLPLGSYVSPTPLRRAALVATLVTLHLVLVAPGARADDATCSINNTTHVASVALVDTANGLRIQRVGDEVVFGTPGFGGTPCGTVTTVDRYEIDAQGTSFVIFDLDGGPFAPGFTDENNGSSEIEFTISDVNDPFDVSVYGTFNADGFAAGQRLIQDGLAFVTGAELNLNALADGSTRDADVTVRALPEYVFFNAGSGDDTISGQGIGGGFSSGQAGPATYALSVWDDYGADTVIGGYGDDFFQPDVNGHISDGDIFQGGEGEDTVDLSFKFAGGSVTLDDVANDGVSCPGLDCENDQMGSDIERVVGSGEDDRIVGASGRQTLEGGGGNNVLIGGSGADRLIGAENGSDEFRGGKGLDVVDYDSHDGGIEVTLDGDANDGLPGELDDVGPDVEAVVGTRGNDRIVGNGKANNLSGNIGDDILVGGVGNDRLDSFEFGGRAEGSDVFRGGSGSDTVFAYGPGPLDLSIDGVANDQIVGNPGYGIDNIRLDVENIVGHGDNDTIKGDGDGNRLVGSYGNDTLVGLGGNDVLLPGAGTDALKGGAGADTGSYTDSLAAITASLAAGVATGDGQDALTAIERLTGSPEIDELRGSGVRNILSGGGGGDRLFGLARDDTLLGGPGGDTLNGGAGTDTCKQGPGSGSQSNCEN